MEKLVEIVHFLHLEINNVFGTAGMYPLKALGSYLLCYLLLISPPLIIIYQPNSVFDIIDKSQPFYPYFSVFRNL